MNRKTFDLIVLTVILMRPAEGLLRMAAKRWCRESDGAVGVIGEAVQIGLGA